jgi:peroxiredoxin
MNKLLATVSLAAVMAFAGAALAEVKVGQPAPDFKATDSYGKTVQLSELRGKTVVLEWTNNGCPYVKKHYNSGNMQALQKKYTSDGVVWLTVASSPQGEQGYVTPEQANNDTRTRNAAPSAVLMDSKSNISRLYGAQVTPHMFIIDAKGTVAYAGAIDSIRSTDPDDVPKATNYVAQALEELKAGKPVTTAATRAYGCFVKYAPQS